ncbi:hypothetical protein BKA58DRAFT_228986 [Alternaria rosae]|uniref:uncharacterized protein n=1 Tax=Alternaria rosae TaxID=1187941 RepID=UPI001E8EB04C|nr:uncharacterized protein BKA58DRAFT_228986 [Alternaria rosae]KAH6865880.1 hypothetical protein BKA58DRAFT_228986 [Alternaria rosae]
MYWRVSAFSQLLTMWLFYTRDDLLTFAWCSASCVRRLYFSWFGYFYSVLIKLNFDSSSFGIPVFSWLLAL